MPEACPWLLDRVPSGTARVDVRRRFPLRCALGKSNVDEHQRGQMRAGNIYSSRLPGL